MNIGTRTGALIATVPTTVSKTPKRLMVIFDGFDARHATTRTTAAAITKTPEHRSAKIYTFLLVRLGQCNLLMTISKVISMTGLTFEKGFASPIIEARGC